MEGFILSLEQLNACVGSVVECILERETHCRNHLIKYAETIGRNMKLPLEWMAGQI